MIHKTTFLGFLFVLFALKGEAQDITRSVIASDGGSSSTTEVKLDWSLGEAVTETVFTDRHILTQGFHQSSIHVERTSARSAEGMFDVSVFPNPASSRLNIKPEFNNDIKYEVTVIDPAGRTLSTHRFYAQDEISQIDVTRLPEGSYFIVIRPDDENLLPITFQFVKTQ